MMIYVSSSPKDRYVLLRYYPTYMCVYIHVYVQIDRFWPTQPPFCPQRGSQFCDERKKRKQILQGTGGNFLFEYDSVCACRNDKEQ